MEGSDTFMKSFFFLCFASIFLYSCTAGYSRSESASIGLNLTFAIDSIKNERYDDAIKDLDNAIKGGPNTPYLFAAHLYRGMAQYAMGNYDAAVADFERTSELASRNEEKGPWIRKVAGIFADRAEKRVPFSKEMLQKLTPY